MTPLGFAMELTRVRVAQGRSQRWLATASGVSRPHISRMESGDRMPSREVAELLAGALGLAGVERARFVMAAGFTPGDRDLVAVMLSSEPALRHALSILERAPENVANRLRAAISDAAWAAQGALERARSTE